MSYPFPSPPMPHQKRALNRAVRLPYFGFMHAMGAGKTYSIICLACYRYRAGQIDAMVVICPTPIKSVWEAEFKKWAPEGTVPSLFVYESGDTKRLSLWAAALDGTKMPVLVVGVEALSQGKAYEDTMQFIKHRNSVMCVVDESSKIKNPQAERTKRVIKIGHMCEYRNIMTGTPVTQGLEDLYPQMQFLSPKILNCKSFFLFKNRYCIMGGFENRNIIGYQYQDELMQLVGDYVDVVTKEQALPDLPPKRYNQVTVELSTEQLVALKQLKDEMRAQDGDKSIEVATVLERLIRYQQIVGGHFPFNTDDETRFNIRPISGKNPKMEALIELVEESAGQHKFIIWARFVPEIELIEAALAVRYGTESVVSFYGKTANRALTTERFQTDPECRFIVSSQQVGGMGQTWTAATVVVYYSNTFSYEDRMQSEDRAHRKGQEHPVSYYDLIANHRADKMIVSAIQSKHDVAKFVESSLQRGDNFI